MRVFGFDLGISSIGWAVVDIEKENPDPQTGRAASGGIVKSGVRIFSIAENPKNGESLAKPRREARLARRSLRRKALRVKDVRKLLADNGFPVPSQTPAKDESSGDADVWRLRARDAFERELDSRELSRVLIHIAKHRGFKSARKSQEESDSGDTGKVLEAINENKSSLGGFKTMAQMIFNKRPKMRNRGIIQADKKDRKTGEIKQVKEQYYGSSIPRDEIEREIDEIFKAQNKYGIIPQDLIDKYKKIAFRFRPIQSVGQMVGFCSLNPKFKRAPKEAPTSELFVALTKINNLKIMENGRERFLDNGEREQILDLLRKTEKVKYSTLLGKVWKGRDVLLNGVSEEDRDKVFHSMTGFHKLKKIVDSGDLSDIKMLDRIIKVIATEKDDDSIEKELRRKKVPQKYIPELKKLSSAKFLDLSLHVLYEIVPEMEKGLTYDKARAAAGYSFKNCGGTSALSNGGLLGEIKESTKVPVVNRAIAQLRKVYNAMVREFGMPDQINLEIGRDLKKTFSERMKIKEKQTKNSDDRAAIAEKLGEKATGKNIIKYRLYDAQSGKCVYSGEPIDLDNLDNYEIDHILPYSRSLDNSLNNKVLVKYAENQAKGNKTPFEYLEPLGLWTEFSERVNATMSLGSRRKYNLLNTKFADDEAGFRERNSNDNAHMAIRAKKIFNDAFPDLRVDVRAGSLTAFLRGQWGLEKDRGESDRHHAQDAIVIACATQGMVQYLSRMSALFENKINEKGKPWWENLKSHIKEPWTGFRRQVLDSISEVFVSRPARKKASGAAHKETIFSQKSGKGSMPLPRGVADKDNMFRFDIFKKDKKYVVVPVFVADTVDKERMDVFYPQPAKSKELAVIDDSYEFVMTLHKDDYIKVATDDNKEYEGYIVQCNMPVGQFIIRSPDNSAVFSVNTNTFAPGDCIVIKDNACKVIGCENGKLQAMQSDGTVHEIDADKKKNRSGEDAKKQIETAARFEKRDARKKINIGTFADMTKYQIGVLGDKTRVKLEKREKVCNIKPKKGRKQPKRKNNGLANPSTDQAVQAVGKE
jgi:CRISPR-associated endonuclease Csn1